ncbi:MAG: HEAT repeat domain-containing protein [Nitrospirae bacterium]|nr:HEAT repeat domain-containing protein [Nitrospirota bacterium]
MPSEAPAGHPEGRGAALLDPEITATADLVEAVARALKTLRPYAPDNPVHQQTRDNTALRLARFVAEHGAFTLGVARDHLHRDGAAVYRDDAPDGLCARLHADGVRAVTLASGLDESQAGRAVALLAQGTGPALDDDDLVTLFWEAGLPHVTLTAVADNPPPALRPAWPAAPGDLARVAARLAAQPAPPGPVAFGPEALAAFRLTPRDEAHLDQLIARERALDPALELAGILGDVLAIEDDPEAFAGLARLYSGFVAASLGQGRLAVAGRQLDTLLALREAGLAAPMRASLDGTLATLAGEPGLTALSDGIGRVFGAGEPDAAALAALGAYLDALPAGDPAAVLRATLAVPAGPVRERLLGTAARFCRSGAGPLLPLLADPDPDLAACAARVIGRVGAEADLDALGALAGHPEMDVRRAALEAIAAIRPMGHPLLLPFLCDLEVALRRRALVLVTDARYTEALEPLRQLTTGELFADMRMGERRAVFATIGTLGGDGALPFFAPHLKARRRLWGRRKGEEVSLCAVSGAKAVGTPAARSLLQEGSRHHNERVRAACGFALRELEGAP